MVIPTLWNFPNLVISSHSYRDSSSLLSLFSNVGLTNPLLLPSIGFILALAVVLILAQKVGAGWLVELFGASIAAVLVTVVLFIAIIAFLVILFIFPTNLVPR
jgi:hypothetical protein